MRTLTALQVKKLAVTNQPELAMQRDIVKALETLGYKVLVPNAGMRTRGALFATPGIPDLFIRRRKWPQGFWCGVELKTETGKLSQAQQKIFDNGGSYVCRSLDDVLEVLEATSKTVGEMPTPTE